MSLVSRGEKAINERYRPMRFSEIIGCDKTKDALTKWMNQGEKRSKAVLLHGVSGGGKAQPLTSKILVQNGWVLMKDIKVGDKIVGGDGKICEVQGVFPQGRRSIYKILFSDGTFIEVSDNHLNSVFIYNTKKKCREDYVLETLELKKLVENSKNKYRIDMPIIDCWADDDITINPYLLGALIGDGSFSGNFGFSNSEEDVVQKVNNILTSEWNMKLVRVNENCYDYRIVFCDNNDYKYSFIYKDKQFNTIKAIQKQLSRDGYPVFDSLTIKNICNGNAVNTLKKYPELNNAIKLVENNSYKCWNDGISPLKNELKKYGLLCKSVQKHIPAQYLFASYNTRLELLRGLFDTDGYTSHEEGCNYEFTTSSNQLAQDFEFLVRSLGIQCSRCEKKSAYKNENNEIISCNTSFCFYLHPSNDMKIFTSLKHSSHYHPKQNSPMRKIVSINYDREDECQCIYVSNDSHTYITDNFTVTHNTTIARILAMGLNCEHGDSVEPCLECPSCKAAMAGEAMHIQEYNMSALTRKEDADEIINSLSDSCFTGRNKMLILDEVQGMSTSSQNLILKSLENPPPNTYLILCLAGETKVSTTQGIKSIKDVKIGDMVQTHDGFEKITNFQCNGIRQTYKISTKYNSIVATDNHPICVLENDTLVWKNVADIRIGDVVPIYQIINTQKGVSLTDSECEFIGRMVGDGYWNKNKKHYNIGILFNSSEREYGEKLLSDCGLSYKGYTRSNVIDYTIHREKGTLNFLEKFGFSEYKNGHKTLPASVPLMNDNQFKMFLKGWNDADGQSGLVRTMIINISESNHLLLNGLKEELHRRGYFFYINKKTRFIENKNKSVGVKSGLYSSYTVTIKILFDDKYNSVPFNEKLAKKVVSKTTNRKFAWMLNLKLRHPEIRNTYIIRPSMAREVLDERAQNALSFQKIISIEKDALQEVFDIEVENKHNFIADGFLVHNCTTNPEKLLKTVRNRCEQYEFKNPTYDDIKIVLGNIVKQEMPEMNISQRKEILEACRGLSYREILMKLEKFIKGGGTDSISEAFQANYFDFCKLVAYGKFREAMEYIEKNEDDFDIEAARRMMRTYFCNAMVSASKTNDVSVHKYYLMCRIFDKGFYTDPNPMPSFKMDVYEACQIMIKNYG